MVLSYLAIFQMKITEFKFNGSIASLSHGKIYNVDELQISRDDTDFTMNADKLV